MPFVSQKQRRLFFAAATTPASKWRGKKKPKISLEMAKEWMRKTSGRLPERIKKREARKKAARAMLSRR